MMVHVSAFAAVAVLLVVSLLVFNPLQLAGRYEVITDEHGQAMVDEHGQPATTMLGAGPWALFTRPAPYGPDSTMPAQFQPQQPEDPNQPQQPEDPINQPPPSTVGEDVQRGIILYNAGQFQAAITQFTQALSVEPDNLTALAHRGLSHFNMGSYHLAIADLTAALRHSNDATLLVWRGASYHNIGFHTEAVADLTSALLTNPANPVALEYRAQAFEAMGNHAAAAADTAAADALRGVAMQ